MRAERLEFDPSTDKATVGVIVSGEVIEENGRLLAYLTPWRKPPLPPRDDPRRRTFNLELIETGWAVLFLIYPSLPRDDDLNHALRAAESAWEQQLDAWKEFGTNTCLATSTGPASSSAPRTGPANPQSRPRPGSPRPSAACASTSHSRDPLPLRLPPHRPAPPALDLATGSRRSPRSAHAARSVNLPPSTSHGFIGLDPVAGPLPAQILTGLSGHGSRLACRSHLTPPLRGSPFSCDA